MQPKFYGDTSCPLHCLFSNHLDGHFGMRLRILTYGMVNRYVGHDFFLCSDPRSQFPANVDSVGGILTIFRADSSNAGVYVCTGSNRAGSDRESIDVSVRRSSGPSEGRPPVIANLPDRVNVPVNQKVELTCMVSATLILECNTC